MPVGYWAPDKRDIVLPSQEDDFSRATAGHLVHVFIPKGIRPTGRLLRLRMPQREGEAARSAWNAMEPDHGQCACRHRAVTTHPVLIGNMGGFRIPTVVECCPGNKAMPCSAMFRTLPLLQCLAVCSRADLEVPIHGLALRT